MAPIRNKVMSNDLLDKHNEKIFTCIECGLVLPESSQFQGKPVCISCVIESGIIIQNDTVENNTLGEEENVITSASDNLISSLESLSDAIKDSELFNETLIEPEAFEESDEIAELEEIEESDEHAELEEIEESDEHAELEEIEESDEHAELEESDEHAELEEIEESDEIYESENAIITDNTNLENTIENNMSTTKIEENDWTTIPAGTFLMGSADAGIDSDEHLHEVTVSDFKILKTPVTFEQYDAFCEETGKPKYNDCKWGRNNRPVIYVSYWDAVDYAQWLSTKTGWECRLPTEAEWEYACRANTDTEYNTGKTITTAQANYDGETPYLLASTGISRNKTMPVKTFPENAFGLYEMHGNVSEWCASEYDPSYSGSEQIDGSLDRSNNIPRTLRGGSWNNSLDELRSATRHKSNPTKRSNEWGFRLVRVD